MWISDNWKDFELVEAEDGLKLERWGDVLLLRPDPQVVWQNGCLNDFSNKICAKYSRSPKGGGSWDYYKKLPESWIVKYKELKFRVRPTGFKHTGLFPEQAVNWDFITEKIGANNQRPINVLNLFAYTGGATVAALSAGANVCHIDAAKSINAWAKENVELNGLGNSSVRFIVEDAYKFAQRELNRGNRYDCIIMDPPSYGRGPNGELWKIEDKIFELISILSKILSDNPLFFIVNSYTTGLSPTVMNNILKLTIKSQFGGSISSDEIGFRTTNSNLYLPCGATSRWER